MVLSPACFPSVLFVLKITGIQEHQLTMRILGPTVSAGSDCGLGPPRRSTAPRSLPSSEKGVAWGVQGEKRALGSAPPGASPCSAGSTGSKMGLCVHVPARTLWTSPEELLASVLPP